MKGLEADTGLRMSEVIAEVLEVPSSQVAVLSGPNLALTRSHRYPRSSQHPRPI